jgi:long-chain acyl-CoA synthetase
MTSNDSDILFYALNSAVNQSQGNERIGSTKVFGEWQDLTAAHFHQRRAHQAAGMLALGIEHGDHVALYMENSWDWIIADLALQSIGAVSVPVYTTMSSESIAYILQHASVKAILVSPTFADATFRETVRKIESLNIVVSLSSRMSIHHQPDVLGGKGAEISLSTEGLETLGAESLKVNPSVVDEATQKLKGDDLLTLIYTSGTTGTPKGVMLTHRNVASNLREALKRIPFTMEQAHGQTVLSYLPLTHIFERMICYLYLSFHAKIHFVEDVKEMPVDLAEVKPFMFASVPRLLEKLHAAVLMRGRDLTGAQRSIFDWAMKQLDSYDPEQPPKSLSPAGISHKLADRLVYAKIRQRFGGELFGIVSAGAALSPTLFRFMNGIGLWCGQGYGLTETSPVLTIQDPTRMRVGSTGKALDNVELRIAEDGEVQAKAPSVTPGYYAQPEQTAEIFTEDGWFKTGDIGRLDDEGNLFITDRKKALLKLSTGKYVAPQPIEDALVQTGFIEQAVVVGNERKFCSALVVPSFESIRKRLVMDGRLPSLSSPTIEREKVQEFIQSLVDAANNRFSPWETIKQFAILDAPFSIESGELTPTLKVKRSFVAKKYQEVIDQLYGS